MKPMIPLLGNDLGRWVSLEGSAPTHRKPVLGLIGNLAFLNVRA